MGYWAGWGNWAEEAISYWTQWTYWAHSAQNPHQLQTSKSKNIASLKKLRLD